MKFQTLLLFYPVMFGFLLTGCENRSDEKPLTPEVSHLEQPDTYTGLWLDCWKWNENEDSYFPRSYGWGHNPDVEYYYYLKSD